MAPASERTLTSYVKARLYCETSRTCHTPGSLSPTRDTTCTAGLVVPITRPLRLNPDALPASAVAGGLGYVVPVRGVGSVPLHKGLSHRGACDARARPASGASLAVCAAVCDKGPVLRWQRLRGRHHRAAIFHPVLLDWQPARIRAGGQASTGSLQPMIAGPCHESYLELRTNIGVLTNSATFCPKKQRHPFPEPKCRSHAVFPLPVLFHAL